MALSLSLSWGFVESKFVIVKKTFSTDSMETIAEILSLISKYYGFSEVTSSLEYVGSVGKTDISKPYFVSYAVFGQTASSFISV